MTETNTALTDAIAKCDEIKARLETLREMSEPKPALRLESITRPGQWKELQSASDLDGCALGTVLLTPYNCRYFRTGDSMMPWITSDGNWATSVSLWNILAPEANRGATFKYLAAN